MHVRRSLYAYLGLLTASVTIAPLCVMAQTMPPVAKVPTFDAPAPVAQSVAMPPMGVDGGMCNAEENYKTIQTDGTFTTLLPGGRFSEETSYATWNKDAKQYWVPTKIVKKDQAGQVVSTTIVEFSPSPVGKIVVSETHNANNQTRAPVHYVKITEKFEGVNRPTVIIATIQSLGENPMPTQQLKRVDWEIEFCILPQ